MSGFDTILIVDWSGGNDRGPTPKKDAIWAGLVRDGVADKPVYLRNRQVAETWMTGVFQQELAAGRRIFAGFDFPFGYPEGFAECVTGTSYPLTLWDWYAENLSEDKNGSNRFELAGRLNALFPGTGPFWFNGLSEDIPHLPRKGRERAGHGLAERRRVETLSVGAFSCWQMGGAGAVGSQAMTGMAALSRLRTRFDGEVSVWPFQKLDKAISFVEVWPSLAAEAVEAAMDMGDIKDAVQVRVLADAVWRMQAADTLAEALNAPTTEARNEEGWILGVGAENALREAAALSARPPLTPPRLRNDCFAMPQGVNWVPVADALERLRDGLNAITDTETISVANAAQRVLAEPCVARRSNPPRPNAAVDGYGFAHQATGIGVQRLPLVGARAAAGQPYRGSVPPGSAIRILTGAILPEGVDTVVLEEDCATDGTSVSFDGPVKAGANTRKAGEDLAEGKTALPAGFRLRAPDLALLSALGVHEISVFRQLRVAVLSTGDEIVPDPALTAEPHQIYDANRPMLLQLAEGWGYKSFDLGHSRDDPERIAAQLDRAAQEADVLLTSGGASAGDEDHVSRLLRERGTLSSWRVAMKPGRPLALAVWNGIPVFGLPGNPVATFVCALVFARPALSLMSGSGWVEPISVTVPAAFEKRKKPGRREYLRARLNANGHAEVFRSEGSGRISGLSWATGLVELPDEGINVRAGTPVRFLPYEGFGLG